MLMMSSCEAILLTKIGFVCRAALLPVVTPTVDCFLVTFWLDALMILIALMSFMSLRLTGKRMDRGLPDTGVTRINCLKGMLVVFRWLFWKLCVAGLLCCGEDNTSAKDTYYMYN